MALDVERSGKKLNSHSAPLAGVFQVSVAGCKLGGGARGLTFANTDQMPLSQPIACEGTVSHCELGSCLPMLAPQGGKRCWEAVVSLGSFPCFACGVEAMSKVVGGLARASQMPRKSLEGRAQGGKVVFE